MTRSILAALAATCCLFTGMVATAQPWADPSTTPATSSASDAGRFMTPNVMAAEVDALRRKMARLSSGCACTQMQTTCTEVPFSTPRCLNGKDEVASKLDELLKRRGARDYSAQLTGLKTQLDKLDEAMGKLNTAIEKLPTKEYLDDTADDVVDRLTTNQNTAIEKLEGRLNKKLDQILEEGSTFCVQVVKAYVSASDAATADDERAALTQVIAACGPPKPPVDHVCNGPLTMTSYRHGAQWRYDCKATGFAWPYWAALPVAAVAGASSWSSMRLAGYSEETQAVTAVSSAVVTAGVSLLLSAVSD